MKRIITSVMLFFFLGIELYGQVETWTVNENNYEYTMSFVGFLNVEGVTLNSTNDIVAAFANGECRGVTNLIYVSDMNRYYAYFNVFSNSSGEVISFKVYDSTHDKVVDIDKTLNFEINALYGNLSQAFSFASPVLNSQADIEKLKFKEVPLLNTSTIDSKINLFVDNGTNVTALNLVFELSPGASLLHNNEVLTSGENAIDFSSPQQLQVLSEDESKLEEWTVSVLSNAVIGNITFFKRDAVCYNGGAIKIVSSGSDSEVVLFKDDVRQVAQNLVEGEAVFKNLETGDYTVRINALEKKVTINLKE